MKTLILYFSYSGHAKTYAQDLAKNTGSDIEEIKTMKRPTAFSTWTAGVLGAILRKEVSILPVVADLDQYDSFILVAPIWAGNPAPAFNSVLALLPKEKDVEVNFMSDSGKSNREETIAFIKEKGIQLSEYRDIISGAQ